MKKIIIINFKDFIQVANEDLHLGHLGKKMNKQDRLKEICLFSNVKFGIIINLVSKYFITY
jgi:hypothetical protein